MGWFTGFVVFVLIWWTTLFAVLPIGTRPVSTPDPLTGWRGAPALPHMRRKLLLTTILSVVLWVGIALVIESDWLSFRHGLLAMPKD